MRYLNDTGFVVKRVNLGEADRFLTLFTQNNGKIEVLAKGVRKITSKRASHIELLNLINFNSIQGKKNLILTEVQMVDSFEEKRVTLQQCEVIFLVCELIERLCPFGAVNYELFSHVKDFLDIGDFSKEALLTFETEMLVQLGFWNKDKTFSSEDESSKFIESLIERKLRSRIITY